jgi:hypothetical protein
MAGQPCGALQKKENSKPQQANYYNQLQSEADDS